MTKERIATKEAGMIYVYPCNGCGQRTGSLTDAPTLCVDCDGHAYMSARFIDDHVCQICDIDEEEHN